MQKVISVPYITEKLPFDGSMSSPIWDKADSCEDFQIYMHEGMPASARTSAYLFHNGEALFIGMKCYDSRSVIAAGNRAINFFSLDRMEIFLGEISPRPNSIQFAVAPGGMQYSGDGDDASWQVATQLHDDFWSAEVRIPFSKFTISNMTAKFNLCRYRVAAKEQQVWAEVGDDFLSVSRYGELCFDSYDAAARAKFQYYSDKPLDRADYSALCERMTPPPSKLAHGPWLYEPGCTAISIGWSNAGGSPAALDYRKKGESAYQRLYSHYEAGVWDKGQSLHKVRLTALQPDTEYEYRICNFLHDAETEEHYPQEAPLSFKTFSPNASDCRFLILTDIHNKKYRLKDFLAGNRLLEQCDFIVNMGDMITNSNGFETIFDGYLDAETPFVSRHPMFNLRGNHEDRGILPTSYIHIFGHESGKPYFAFRFGELCIIGIDGGEDYLNAFNTPYIEEENRWLKEVVQSELFMTARKHILLSHIPILEEAKYTPVIQKLLDGVFYGEKPMAKIDVMLCGHTHRASYTAPNADTCTCYFLDGTEIRKCTPAPFPTICNAGPDKREPLMSALYVQYHQGKLTVDIILPDCTSLKQFTF